MCSVWALRGSAVMHPSAAPQRGRMASVSAHQASLVTEPSLSLDDCFKSQSNMPFHLSVNRMEET